MPRRPTDPGAVARYCCDVFGREDDHLRTLTARAIAAGLPDIAVSADVGRLLSIITSIAGPAGGPATSALELGTLAGYSGTWIARALAPAGTLTTIEPEPKHADFAQRGFDQAGLAARITILREPALIVLPRLLRSPGPASFDVIFLDAIKAEYPDYWKFCRELIRPGGFILADNVLASSEWAIEDPPGSNPSRDGADALNRLAAADPDFESVAVPIRSGILIARRRPR